MTSTLKSMRYSLVRFWTCPLPGIPYSWPLVGGRTIPEIIIILGIIAFLLGISIPINSKSVGDIIAYVAFALVFFSVRSNVLLHAMGISFERGLLYHKVIGATLMALVLIHAIGEGMNSSGVVLGITMLGAPLVYLFDYFFGYFSVFYYSHMLLALVTIPTAFIHEATLLGVALLFWLADLVIRNILLGQKHSTEARVISDEIICLELALEPPVESKPWMNWLTGKQYEAGQYCFLMIPGVNMVEYHPFTIASAPHSPHDASRNNAKNTMTFYLKRNGDWTEKVYRLIQNGSISSKAMALDVYREGPYGVLSVDLFNPHVYETVLLVSGGVGVTPMLSLWSFLTSDLQPNTTIDNGVLKANKRRKLVFVWSVRDAAFATHVLEERMMPLLNQLHFAVAQKSTDQGTGLVFKATDKTPPFLFTQEIHLQVYFTGNQDALQSSLSSLAEGGRMKQREESKDGPLPLQDCFIKGKRPDFPAIFSSISSGKDVPERVGVAVCGPSAMVAQVRDLCDGSLSVTQAFSNKTRFDCHEEIFNF